MSCNHCNREKLFKCPCMTVSYCTVACQKIDWNNHKLVHNYALKTNKIINDVYSMMVLYNIMMVWSGVLISVDRHFVFYYRMDNFDSVVEYNIGKATFYGQFDLMGMYPKVRKFSDMAISSKVIRVDTKFNRVISMDLI